MILFKGYDKYPNRNVGWGDIYTYSLVCYLFGKEKGYRDEEIYIIFPTYGYIKIFDNYTYQDTKFLPWNYYERGKAINEEDWTEIVDTTEKDSLFEHFSGFPHPQISGLNMDVAVSVYYKITGKKPYLDLPRTYKGKPYILFQYRKHLLGAMSQMRITSIDELKIIYNTIKDKLGDKYEYWKIGEPCEMDNKFDKVIPLMYNNLDGFIEILRNSSMFIGGHSGPPQMAYYFEDLPVIRFGMLPVLDSMNFVPRLAREINKPLLSKYNINYHPCWRDETFLYRRKNMIPKDKIGLMYIERHKQINKDDILKMIDDWNL